MRNIHIRIFAEIILLRNFLENVAVALKHLLGSGDSGSLYNPVRGELRVR
jgi:hypothetical protein